MDQNNKTLEYSIIFNGINELKDKFYYSINSKFKKKVSLKVYNSYLNFLEFEDELELQPNIGYWTFIPTNYKERYVEFCDSETGKVVGLFGLDGLNSFQDMDNLNYIKTIFDGLNLTEQHTIKSIFNEVSIRNIYNNNFFKVNENDFVIDIGFNYGLFSLDSLKYNPKKIIGFEPNPNLVKTFKNFYNGDIIELYQKAVSNYNGTTTFYENSCTGMSTLSSDLINIPNSVSYQVDIINFNDFINEKNINIIDYLKVDCEGSEYEIFQSIPNNFLSQNIKKIVIEFHHLITDDKVQTLLNKLKNCGFNLEISNIDGTPLGLIYAKK